jgi:hypothetical protein
MGTTEMVGEGQVPLEDGTGYPLETPVPEFVGRMLPESVGIASIVEELALESELGVVTTVVKV